MTVNNTSYLVKTDKLFDYVPVISTVSNLIDLFQKCVVIPLMKQSSIDNSHYYTHLDQKSFSRCVVLLIPFLGNIAVGIYDFVNRKYDDKTFMLAAITKNGPAALKDASPRLRNDADFMLKALSCRDQYKGEDDKAFDEVFDKALKDEGFDTSKLNQANEADKKKIGSIYKATLKSMHVLGFLGEQLKNNADFLNRILLKCDFMVFVICLGEKLKNNPDFILKVSAGGLGGMKCNVLLTEIAGDELKSNQDFILKLLNKRIFNNKDQEAIRNFTSDTLKKDPAFVVKVAEIVPLTALEFARNVHNGNLDVMSKIVEKESSYNLDKVLDVASGDLKDNSTFMLSVAGKDANMVKHASDRLKNDPSFMLNAAPSVDDKGHVCYNFMFHLSQHLKEDKTFLIDLVTKNYHSFNALSKELKADLEISAAYSLAVKLGKS